MNWLLGLGIFGLVCVFLLISLVGFFRIGRMRRKPIVPTPDGPREGPSDWELIREKYVNNKPQEKGE